MDHRRRRSVPRRPGHRTRTCQTVGVTKAQFALWSHTHLAIDVVPGRGAGFSVEAPTGKRFLIRSRLLDGTLAPVEPLSCEVPSS
jgi:hypothetical protein